MTFSYQKAQTIRLKPTNDSSFAVSMPIHYEATLFAFSCDHLIYIYNRSDFSQKIIETSDPTSSVILFTFAYNTNRDYFIFCVKDNQNIYQISMDNFSIIHVYNQIGNVIPHSLTSCINRIFYLSEKNLYSFHFFEENASLIAENITYKEVVSSPNGSAVALFTKGEKDIKILYYPFEKDSFTFTFNSPLVDFQWDCSHYLAAVTACADKSVKVWLQKPHAIEMYCICSFTFSEPIVTISFCHDFTDAEFIGTFENSIGNAAEPSLKRPKAKLLVTTTNSMILCEETEEKTLVQIMSTKLPFNDQIATVCYLFKIYSNGEIEQRFDITFFTKSGLFFHQLELTPTKYVQLTPFRIKFMTDPIDRIVPFAPNLVTKSDSRFYDWYNDEEIDKLTYKVGQFSGEIANIENVLDMKSDNDKLLTLLLKDVTFGSFDIFLKKHVTFDFHTDDEIVSGTIRSENIFAICTKSEVICYVLENDTFQVLSKLKANRPIARFLPNPYLLISISSGNELTFYSIQYKRFTFISKITSAPIIDFAYKEDMNSIIVLTGNNFFLYDFDLELPKIHSINDDYVFLTSLTLCLFSVISKRQKEENVTLNDFVTRDDSYILPSFYSSNLPPQFEPFCPLNSPGWETLSECGRKFIFSYNFARFNDQKLIPFFSIWAFLSKDQHLLIGPLCFQRSREIITSYAPLWVRDDSVLSSFVVEIVNKTYPNEDELDLYLLLCVLVNKCSIASKVALKHGSKKIAKYLNSEKETNLSKVEKSAYEALKLHRYELASLFFIIMKRNDQALHVIKNDLLLYLLVARLLNEKERQKTVLNQEEFFASKDLSNINRFFTIYKENKSEAIDLLINFELPNCELLSLDAHRCEMIKEMTRNVPKIMLLNLQFVPYFIKKFYIKPYSISSSSKKAGKANSKVKDKKTELQKNYDFDFGGLNDLDMIEIDEEAENEEKEFDNEANNKALIDESNFANCFDKEEFKTSKFVVFTINNSFIIDQINKLFNVQFDERTVKSLTAITRLISERATIAAILFAMSFALSKSSMIIPLLDSFDFELENYFDEFEHCKVEIKPPDLLSRFANLSTEVTENDISIVNCLTFNKMALNLSESNSFANIKFLAHYFHHRHRIMFKKIKSFFFSNAGLIDDIDPLQLNPIENIEKMEKVSLHEKWLIAFNSSFSTPFFMDNKFSFTRSFIAKTGLDGPIQGVSIDQQNNQKVAIVSESLNAIKLTPYELNGKYNGSDEEDKYLYFDSPFARLLETETIHEKKQEFDYKFECNWSKGRLLKTFLKTTACDSHSKSEIYVTGEMNGNLKLWEYSSLIPRTIYTNSFIESPIEAVRFNEPGDKILVANKDGQVYVNDLNDDSDDMIQMICSREKSTTSWFNGSNQIIVVQPKDALLCLYDMRVPPTTTGAIAVKIRSKSASILKKYQSLDDLNALKPVLTYGLAARSEKRCPVDVWEHRVAIGDTEGRISIFDIRSMNPGTKRVHNGRVKAVKFHPSGRFIIAGGADNSVSICDPNNFFGKTEIIEKVLPPNLYDRKSGINDIAVSRQSIVVAGCSKVMQVWTVENEKMKGFKKSLSSAIDLRNLTVVSVHGSLSDQSFD